MSPRQQRSRRLLAKDVLALGGVQVECRVALSALELANPQWTIEARQSAAQVPCEGGLIKAVRRQHRYQFCNTVHRCHITAGPTERLDVR